jgi:hypothetical protein
MEAMDPSGRQLCQMIHDASLRPGTEQRLQTVLATADVIALDNDGFASHMGEMMVRSFRKFIAAKKRVDDLAVLLQPACPGSSLPATLIVLQGDKLFEALVALQLPEARRRMCTSRPRSPRSALPCEKLQPTHPRL